MFREFGCGCIVSIEQGRVRTCLSHKPGAARGDGGSFDGLRGAGVKLYPANGQMPANWNGR